MPNTFLNTGRTVTATSNPQANVQQVQPVSTNIQQNTAVQPTQNNNVAPQQNTNTNTNNNAINPITIPIQIQPTVATQNQQQAQPQQIQAQENLQAQSESNAAPTPQTYQAQSTNNIVDFNQIYSSYQNAFGNNSSNGTTGSSGIKKTSIGTTIVTPTNANLNTVEGMYQSAYSDTINRLLSEMISQLENRFSI